ncbi:MAG: tryptophan--tRNA ligase [Patescibacteria group bacterium]|jgi:tryptophanyl-tRNA synthetase
MKPILLSGVKPTNRVHIGNYFGAMKQFVDLQDDYRNYIFIADYHALNQLKDAKELSAYSWELIISYLSIGLDPKKTVLFKQSDAPQVCELQWIFNCLLPLPYLQRAHAYKDAVAKKREVNMGLFCYPVLMAADILMYDADVVPVGEDQKQHLEMAIDLANKFNHQWGETFKAPQPLIMKEMLIIGTDGDKMSKSKNNIIELFEPEESLKKKVMSIKTDSKGVTDKKDPEADNVFAFHKLFSQPRLEELRQRYEEGGIGYKESKEILLNNILEYTAPFRKRRAELLKDKNYVLGILEDGAKRADKAAEAKMEKVRRAIGVKSTG